MRVLRRLGERQHRGDARIAPFEDAAPFPAAPHAEEGGEPLLRRRPGGGVISRRELAAIEADAAAELGEEFLLDRRDGKELAVGAFIDLVEEGARIEDVVAPPRGAL